MMNPKWFDNTLVLNSQLLPWLTYVSVGRKELALMFSQLIGALWYIYVSEQGHHWFRQCLRFVPNKQQAITYISFDLLSIRSLETNQNTNIVLIGWNKNKKK